MLKPLQAHHVVTRAANALLTSTETITLDDCVQVHERMMLASTIATLLENGFEEAVEFLIEHDDLDPQNSLDLFAILNLGDDDTQQDLMNRIKDIRGDSDDEAE